MARRLPGGVVWLALVFQAGCYGYLPVQLEVPNVAQVAVYLNDRGRLQLSEAVGSMVEWVEGPVVAQDSVRVRVQVNRVVYLRGGAAIWSGEPIEIPRDGIAGFRGRQLSRARSWALAGAVLGTVVISALVFDLNLFGDAGGDSPCTGPTCGVNPSIRW